MKKLIYFFALTLITVLLLSFFIFKTTPSRPNIILISIDSLRRDHVGIYGYNRNTTPTIDKIAREGIYFENAFSSSSWTLPAHMSMFTGLPPSIHSVDKETNKLNKDIQTVTELIKFNKYQTAAIVTLPFIAAKYGFSKGFDKYTEMFKKKAKVVTDNALGWLKKRKNKPFFLFLHFCDVHWPYAPPVKYANMFGISTKKKAWKHWGRFMFLRKFSNPAISMPENIKKKVIGLYDAEIRSVDDNISRIIEYLQKNNIYNNTILVFTSDHGEEFKEHSSFGHGHSLYSEVINVPLIIRFPDKIKKGLKIKEPVITSDIPLTLLNMLKIKPHSQFIKYSANLEHYFLQSSKNKIKDRQLLVGSNSTCGPKRFAIIKNGHKYIAPFKFHPYRLTKKNDSKYISPLKSHTGKNENIWVQIPKSFYNIFKDPKDLKNLIPHGVPLIKKTFAIQRDLISGLNRYIDKNVKGVQLVFYPSSNSAVELMTYTGSVKFNHEHSGLPFGVNFSVPDFLDGEEIDGRFKFSVFLKSSIKKIYLPISNATKKISINIRQNGNLIFQKSIIPPKTNKSLILVPESNYNGNIFIKGSIPGILSEKTSISDKEKKLLETLGYI